jgi:purine nucleosidase
MRCPLRALTLAVVVATVLTGPSPGYGGEPRPPVPLIFDTDICGDCDDVLALGMIHSFQSRGACRLLAVTVSANNDLAAPFVDAINTFYGRGQIPIGVVGKEGVVAASRFLPLAEQRDGGQLRFPHDLASGRSAPDATSVLRAALAGEADGSVVIAQVGFSTNLARLLDSPADKLSPLSGLELVRKKVKLLSLMAGAFRPIEGKARFQEYNVVQDAPSCRALAARWPSQIVWSGFEIGIALPYPAVSIERDYAYVAHHPVAEAYIRYIPPPHERPTWDLTSVLYAVHPDRDYFNVSEPGVVTIEPDGSSRFEARRDGRQRYLILRPDQIPRIREAEVQLSSQPPDHAAKSVSQRGSTSGVVRPAE